MWALRKEYGKKIAHTGWVSGTYFFFRLLPCYKEMFSILQSQQINPSADVIFSLLWNIVVKLGKFNVKCITSLAVNVSWTFLNCYTIS